MIETQRLTLREFTLDDAQAVLDFSSHPEVTLYTGDAGDIADLDGAKEVINNIWIKEYKEYGYARFALVEKESQKVIGFAGLKYLPEFDLPDLGYRMLPEFWGKGYATESATACMKYAKEELKLPKVMAMVMPKNIASEKVLLKLGFEQTGTTDLDGHLVKVFEINL